MASAVAGAGSDFERIWKAYGKLGNKKASRAAFEAIENPDIDMIVERAASWAASAKLGQKRMPLEKWLAAEKYDEADRRVEPKAPKPEREPDDSFVTRPAKITSAFEEDDEEFTRLHVTFRRDDGEEFAQILAVRAPNAVVQDAARRMLDKITDAIGIAEVNRPEDLIGGEVDISIQRGAVVVHKPFRASAPRPVPKRPKGGWSGMYTGVEEVAARPTLTGGRVKNCAPAFACRCALIRIGHNDHHRTHRLDRPARQA